MCDGHSPHPTTLRSYLNVANVLSTGSCLAAVAAIVETVRDGCLRRGVGSSWQRH
jgi:hypothetical protein